MLGRVFLVLYSLVWIGACVGLGVLAWNDKQKLDLSAGDLNLQAFFATEGAGTERWALTGLLAALGLLGIATILIAVLRAGGAKGVLRIAGQDGTVIEVAAPAVESLLGDELERLPEVRRATVRVRPRGAAVESDIAVVIEPSASIAHATAAVTQLAAQVLREQVGVTNIRRPIVRISYDELSARPVRPGGPRPPAPPAAPAPKDAENGMSEPE